MIWFVRVHSSCAQSLKSTPCCSWPAHTMPCTLVQTHRAESCPAFPSLRPATSTGLLHAAVVASCCVVPFPSRGVLPSTACGLWACGPQASLVRTVTGALAPPAPFTAGCLLWVAEAGSSRKHLPPKAHVSQTLSALAACNVQAVVQSRKLIVQKVLQVCTLGYCLARLGGCGASEVLAVSRTTWCVCGAVDRACIEHVCSCTPLSLRCQVADTMPEEEQM